MSADKPTVFISYSHQDELWLQRLVRHLSAPAEQPAFEVWSDKAIEAGAAWKARIDAAVAKATVAVLLVSADFLASSFIRDHEVPALLRRRESDGLPVVPILVSPCRWKRVPWLADLELRPVGAQPLSAGSTHEIEDALARIADEVEGLIERQKARRAAAAARDASGAGARVASGAAVPVPPPPPVSPTPAATPTVEPAVVAPPGVTLQRFEFATVTVDDQGRELERRQLECQGFTEDLGGGVTLEMVAIPRGTFLMGAPEGEAESADDERPQRKVTVAPFFFGRFAVTQEQWRAVAAWPRVAAELEADPSAFKGGRRPVEQVSWHDAVELCARLSHRTGRTYRLPSEAEWEYAARAGTTGPFAFGPTITPEWVNYDGNHPYGRAAKGVYREATVDVGSLGVANRFGLFDMHGNVWEWMQDVWHNSYQGAPNDGRAWESGGDPTGRVLRGGAWINYARNCRSAVRYRSRPEDRNHYIGVRVVCAVSRTQ